MQYKQINKILKKHRLLNRTGMSFNLFPLSVKITS